MLLDYLPRYLSHPLFLLLPPLEIQENLNVIKMWKFHGFYYSFSPQRQLADKSVNIATTTAITTIVKEFREDSYNSHFSLG
jgi:hypothetical protein